MQDLAAIIYFFDVYNIVCIMSMDKFHFRTFPSKPPKIASICNCYSFCFLFMYRSKIKNIPECTKDVYISFLLKFSQML